MEKIVETLKSVKTNLPATRTFSNVGKLHSGFLEYQHIVASLPENYQQLKNKYEKNFTALKLKIDAIADNSNSQKAARYCFKDALYHIQTEIDSIILSISEENNPAREGA